jgi:hypothetical protein
VGQLHNFNQLIIHLNESIFKNEISGMQNGMEFGL